MASDIGALKQACIYRSEAHADTFLIIQCKTTNAMGTVLNIYLSLLQIRKPAGCARSLLELHICGEEY